MSRWECNNVRRLCFQLQKPIWTQPAWAVVKEIIMNQKTRQLSSLNCTLAFIIPVTWVQMSLNACKQSWSQTPTRIRLRNLWTNLSAHEKSCSWLPSCHGGPKTDSCWECTSSTPGAQSQASVLLVIEWRLSRRGSHLLDHQSSILLFPTGS